MIDCQKALSFFPKVGFLFLKFIAGHWFRPFFLMVQPGTLDIWAGSRIYGELDVSSLWFKQWPLVVDKGA